MTKVLITGLMGVILGTLVSLALLAAGLARNPVTILAWAFLGGGIAFGHGVGHAVLEAVARWTAEQRERPEDTSGRPGRPGGPARPGDFPGEDPAS